MPTTSSRAAAFAIVPLALLFTAGCGGDDGTAPPVVGSVSLEADDTQLVTGQTTQLTVTVLDENGDALPDAEVTWTSRDSEIVTVDGVGEVTAKGQGIGRIWAASGSIAAEAEFVVWAPFCSPETVTAAAPVGSSVTGSLSLADCTYGGGPFVDVYEIVVDEDSAFELTLTSDDFDAVLAIADPGMNLYSFSDGGAGGTDARLEAAVPPGTWYFLVAPFYEGERGDYEFAVETSDMAFCEGPVGTLPANGSRTGELAAGDCFQPVVGVTDPWELELDESAALRLDLTSDDFDALLVVADSDGEFVDFDDDGGGGTNAQLDVELDAGVYTVFVTSLSGQGAGSYDLTAGPAGDASTTAASRVSVGSASLPLRRAAKAGWPGGGR